MGIETIRLTEGVASVNNLVMAEPQKAEELPLPSTKELVEGVKDIEERAVEAVEKSATQKLTLLMTDADLAKRGSDPDKLKVATQQIEQLLPHSAVEIADQIRSAKVQEVAQALLNIGVSRDAVNHLYIQGVSGKSTELSGLKVAVGKEMERRKVVRSELGKSIGLDEKDVLASEAEVAKVMGADLAWRAVEQKLAQVKGKAVEPLKSTAGEKTRFYPKE